MSYSSELQKHLAEWVMAVSGYDGQHVIWESVNAPRPTRPYASLRISSAQLTGQPSRLNKGDGEIRIKRDLLFTFTINTFSADIGGQDMDANELLWELYLSIALQSTQAKFNEYNLGFLEVLSNTDITALMGTEFEQRATMDLSFMTGIEIIDDVGWFTTVKGTGTIGSKSIDYEVSLPPTP